LAPKKTTIQFKVTVKDYPSRWEINSLKIKINNEIKRHLLKVLELEITIFCQVCGFGTVVNPAKHKTARWYCRSCGHVILYDNGVVKN
jgi:ribosomal protein S27AE